MHINPLKFRVDHCQDEESLGFGVDTVYRNMVHSTKSMESILFKVFSVNVFSSMC